MRAGVRVCACFLRACAHTHKHTKVASILNSVHAYICITHADMHRMCGYNRWLPPPNSLDLVNYRIYIEFTDEEGAVSGSSSVAVTTE